MSEALQQLQREIADENCRVLIEIRAQQVNAINARPLYDTSALQPWQITDEDMLATRRQDVVRAVQYLDMRGLIDRPVAGKPHLVSFKEGAP